MPIIAAIDPEMIRAIWLAPEMALSPYIYTLKDNNPIKNMIGIKDRR